MKSSTRFLSIPLVSTLCLLVFLAGCPAPLTAAASRVMIGARLLRAQLPAGVSIPQADCEQLAHAVSQAVAAHRADAAAILSAALDGGETTSRHESKFSCACVTRILRAAVSAAPAQASNLLEIAIALYPDCADALTAALADADAAESGDQDAIVPGFGVGFGPGFPGSPGFTGSSPSGAIALPTPAPETSVVNG